MSASAFCFSPRFPIPLAGYAKRLGLCEKVDSDLTAVFLLLSDDGGGEVLLGSVDTLFLGARVLKDIKDELGASEIPLCLFATHTHNAPSLAPELPLLGRHDAGWYGSFVLTCARAIRELVHRPREAVVMRVGEQATDLNVNRRRPAWVIDYPALLRDHRLRIGRRIALAANRRGIVDRRVRAIFFENASSEVKAVLWSLAAHPAFYPASRRVSPDFPGLVRDALRRRFGQECAIVYLPGFAGSAIPNMPFHVPKTWKGAAGSLLPFYPVLRSFGPKGYQHWCDRLYQSILFAYEARRATIPDTGVSVDRIRVPGIFRCRDRTSNRAEIDLDIVRAKLASDVDILACNGEMLGEWAPLLAPIIDPTTLLSGYLAGSALYVPTSRELPEGGYEVTGFQKPFGLDGEFHPEISRLVTSAIERLYRPGSQPPEQESVLVESGDEVE